MYIHKCARKLVRMICREQSRKDQQHRNEIGPAYLFAKIRSEVSDDCFQLGVLRDQCDPKIGKSSVAEKGGPRYPLMPSFCLIFVHIRPDCLPSCWSPIR